MSYHYIEVAQRFKLECNKCPWTKVVDTAGKAEEEARAHLEDDTVSNFYYHQVTILSMTVLGRDL